MIVVHLIRIGVITMALLGVGPSVATGQIFDLTGTWAGSITCKALNAGVKEKVTTNPVMTVTQVDTQVGVRLDFGGGSVVHYTGLANPDGKKPETKGEAALIRCGTDDLPDSDLSPDEMGRFTAATKAPPVVKATLKGTTVLTELERIGTCTWKWTRTAVADPGLSTECAQ